MTNSDDSDRYVGYLQGAAISSGWQDVFCSRKWLEWVRESSTQIRERAASILPGREAEVHQRIERLARQFRPTTQFELAQTEAIFGGMLDQIRATARALGYPDVRPIRLATSTDLSATPLSRPTSAGEHLLFLGPGTWCFCDSWSRVYTSAFMALESLNAPINSHSDVCDILIKDLEFLNLLLRVAFAYWKDGSLVGLRPVPQPTSYFPLRSAILYAMEEYVVGHEFAHFIAEEHEPQFSGLLELSRQHELELYCDQVGLRLARDLGVRKENPIGGGGLGALCFLRAAEIQVTLRDSLVQERTEAPRESSHPAPGERVLAIRNGISMDDSDGVRESVLDQFDACDHVAKALRELVLAAIGHAQNDPRVMELLRVQDGEPE